MNRKIEYSLMALKHMSLKTPGELTSAKEVSENYKAPFDATARVMQQMANRGLLRSEQGATGGYQITRDLSKISLKDLIEMIQGPTQIAKCLKSSKCDLKNNCNIISPITTLNHKLNEFYESLSVKDIIHHKVRDEERGRP